MKKKANTIYIKRKEIVRLEYHNLQDNIRKEEYNDRTKGILQWIKENRDKADWAKDPNAYEMTNVFLLGGKYRQEGEKIDIEALDEMWNIRSKDFEHAGIMDQSFVYKICEDAYQSVQDGKALVNDEASHHALRKMAAIGLYCSQQRRDKENIKYNNPGELLELLETARTLKGVHPDLYEKYQFQANLERLCELQPENSLQNRIQKAMETLEQEKEDIKDEKENRNNEMNR